MNIFLTSLSVYINKNSNAVLLIIRGFFTKTIILQEFPFGGSAIFLYLVVPDF